MDGGGDFLIYGDSANYFRFDVSDKLDIKAETFGLDAGSLIISSSMDSGNGVIRLGGSGGPSSPTADTAGIYMDGGGALNVYGDANNYFRFDVGGTPVLDMKAETFYLGGSSQYVSGSNGNLEISSSNFHLDNSGNVTMTGTVTAEAGEIGGFTIGTDLDSTSGTLKLKGASGQLTASAAQITGKITAQTGTIGGFTIGTDLDSTSGNLKIAGSSGTVRSGTSSGQRVTLASNSLTFHNSSNTQVLQLVNSLSKTINIAGGGLGGSGNTTFTSNGGIDFASAGAIFINGTASGTFADVFIGPNNIIHQANNQTEKYTFSLGNYLDDSFGDEKSVYGMNLFVYQGGDAGSSDINIEALNVNATYNQGLDSLTAGSKIRGATIKATDNPYGHTSGNAAGLYVDLKAKDSGSNYGIYVDFHSQETLLGSDDAVSSGYGVYSTAKIASEKDIVAFVSSDKRLKTNIKPVDDSLNKIIKLNGVSFEWKDGYDDRVQNKTNLGVIAQEVQEVLPEIVKERDDGYLAVKYEQLVPVLIEGMKEQQTQIDELKQKLEEL
jgi:hypothetical protein